jgi:O-antigen/teichoic acid export membrane protein
MGINTYHSMVQNIAIKLSNKNSFTYMAYKVIKSKALSSVLLFMSSIILIRHLPKEDFGLYVLMISFFALFELFMGGFDASLVRFIPTAGKTKQHSLITAVFIIKTIITLLSLFTLILLFDYSIVLLNIPLDKIELYKSMYLLMTIIFIFKYIGTINLNILISYMRYDELFKISLLNSIATLFATIYVSYMSLDLEKYIFLLIFININKVSIGLVYIYRSKILSFKMLIKQINIIKLKQTFKDFILSYSTPLLGVSILSYIKNYLPTYIFGTMVSLETLAVYSIFKKITDFLHKGYAGIIQGLYPKLFKMIHSKSKAIDIIFWIGLGLRVMVFTGLYFGYDLILSIYDIKESPLDYLIFTVLVSVFLIMYFATFSNLIIMSTSNTNIIFTTAIIRTILFLIITFILYNFFNIEGLIVSIYINSIIGLAIIVKYTNKYYNLSFFNIYFYILILITFYNISINLIGII